MKNIESVSFYKAVKLDKDMVESVSKKNTRFAHVNIEEYKDVGLLVSTSTTIVVVPYANIACYISSPEEKQEEKPKVNKAK